MLFENSEYRFNQDDNFFLCVTLECLKHRIGKDFLDIMHELVYPTQEKTFFRAKNKILRFIHSDKALSAHAKHAITYLQKEYNITITPDNLLLRATLALSNYGMYSAVSQTNGESDYLTIRSLFRNLIANRQPEATANQRRQAINHAQASQIADEYAKWREAQSADDSMNREARQAKAAADRKVAEARKAAAARFNQFFASTYAAISTAHVDSEDIDQSEAAEVFANTVSFMLNMKQAEESRQAKAEADRKVAEAKAKEEATLHAALLHGPKRSRL